MAWSAWSVSSKPAWITPADVIFLPFGSRGEAAIGSSGPPGFGRMLDSTWFSLELFPAVPVPPGQLTGRDSDFGTCGICPGPTMPRGAADKGAIGWVALAPAASNGSGICCAGRRVVTSMTAVQITTP